uniref:Uncharacterized protein n=1 Tax=viral metagenome TaxID=1070528 RepID=A0A6C0HM15_9ZZZZ
MAQAYLWQQRFAPPAETASVRFPKKIQFNPKCPTVNKCGLGAVTAVSIDSNAVVTLTSTYKMEGTDRFRFAVSNVLSNTSYTLEMKQSSSNYPTAAELFGDLCVVSVSPIINEYACSTCNVLYTSLPPSAPFNVKTTTSNVTWNTPIIPENYGFPTITSYTLSGGATYLISDPNLTIVSNTASLSLTSPVGQTTYVYATNMAGSSLFSRPG